MLRKHRTQKESLVYIDDLTSLYNRRYLKILQKNIEEFREANIPFSLVIVDIDHFKDINDSHGHQKGDEIIKEFAHFLKDTLRTTDTVVRYGGDEFVCLMPHAQRKEVHQIYTRILDRCKKKKFDDLSISISVGVASYPEDGKEFEELLKIADYSLYDAKRSGRARVGTVHKKRIELPTKAHVGRRGEKEVLTAFLAQPKGYARAVLIEGNVGIGKTRLVKEVLKTIDDCEILWSDCLKFFEGIPYYPVREIIKYKIRRQGQKIVNELPLAFRIEVGKLVPEVMEEVKENIDEVGLVMDKYRLYESIRRIFSLGNIKKIIVIDNMQWADRESTEVIEYLLRTLRSFPMTFVFIYRQEETSKVLNDFTTYISRETEVKKVELFPLEGVEVKQMVELIIGEEPHTALVDYIRQGSGGNPFYIEEIIKELRSGGYLSVEADQWEFLKPDVDIIPKSIEDVTGRKYQSLSKEGKEIIEVASVIGRFDIEIIKAITGHNEGHIIGLVENINRLGLIKQRNGQIEFQDEISRDVIYQNYVSNLRARTLHKSVGEEIEKQYQGKEKEKIEELAFHYYRALDNEKGVKYSVEAGVRSKEKYAYRGSIKYYTWAEELLRHQSDVTSKKKRIDCLKERSDMLGLIGENEEAINDLHEALKIAKELKDKKIEVDIKYSIASIYVTISQFTDAINEANKCLKIYEGMRDKDGIAKTLFLISGAYGRAGENEKSLQFGKEALKNFRVLKDRNNIAKQLIIDGILYFRLGKNQKAIKNYKNALEIMREQGDKPNEAISILNIGTIYDHLREHNKAIKNYEDSLKISRDIGTKYAETLALINLGAVYDVFGEFKKALSYYGDALKISSDIRDKDCETGARNNIGITYMNLGEYSRALKCFEECMKTAKDIESNEIIFKTSVNFANLYLDLGEKQKSKKFIDKAYNMVKDTDSKLWLEDILNVMCNFYLEEKNIKELDKYVEKIITLHKDVGYKKHDGNLNLLMGRYYTEIKDFEMAKKHLDEALRVSTESNEQLNIGKAYYYIGIFELLRGDKKASKINFEKSLKVFNKIDARGWIKKIKSRNQCGK
jgi:diguanylate cyclase (GGDEF)-like protein